MSTRHPATMLAQLTLASWETVYRRSLLMAQGTLTAVEYQRMFVEKAAAFQASAMAMMWGRGGAAMMSPYLTRARANAQRLRNGG